MTTCPKCNSTNIDKLNYGKRAGATVGAAAALGGGAAGGKAGATAGAVTGRAIDEHILNNYACLKCGYKFNEA
jgi:transposase-like protein